MSRERSILSEILTHFRVRAQKNLPLAGTPEEEEALAKTSLGRSRSYRRIKADLVRGQSLSQAFAALKGVSPSMVMLIKDGEESGALDKALELASRQLPIERQFVGRLNAVYKYPALVLTALLVSVLYFPTVYGPLLAPVAPYGEFGVIAGVFEFMRSPWFFGSVLILFCLNLWVAFRPIQVHRLGRRWAGLPIIGPSVYQILSLDMGLNVQFGLALGRTGPEIINQLAQRMRPVWVGELFGKVMRDVDQGRTLTEALARQPGLGRFPVVEVIGVGLASGNPDPLVTEFNEFLSDHLKKDIPRRLTRFREKIIVLYGLLVGAWVIFFYTAIFRLPVYWWPDYLQ